MAKVLNNHSEEIRRGLRFEFGKNWTRFLSVLSEERIIEAEKSLRTMLGTESMSGKTFLDVGSGSGLFSLAARRMGASVRSFDYDPHSVACTRLLKCLYFPDDVNWIIEEGSILDLDYIGALGKFDIVYSWGVLHHTGAMWHALENASLLCATGGQLYISIYNDQGNKSKRWRTVKRFYNSGYFGKALVSFLFVPYFVLGGLAVDVLNGRNPVTRYTEYKTTRGMSRVYDWFDWLGGYPFEVAKPEEIFEFYRKKGFHLDVLKTCGGGLGCNEYVLWNSANKHSVT